MSIRARSNSGGRSLRAKRKHRAADRGDEHGALHWSWARLLKRVFALAMARCPWCLQGTLRLIATITYGEVLQRETERS